jgi:hypothetical protein
MSHLSSQPPEIKAEKLSQSPRWAGSAWAREKRFADVLGRRMAYIERGVGHLRLRQAAHCLLPSLEPSLPIDVRLGPPRPIGGPRAVCCGHDHSIWIRRIHGHAHEVAVLQSILGRTPRVRSIGAFKVPVTGGRVNPPGCKRVRQRRVRIVRTAANAITPGPPAVERAHERASFDRDEHAIRDAHIGFDPPNMMRVGAWGKTPGVSRRERAQSG